MNILGLDLGSNLIKAVELKKEKKSSTLVNIAKVESSDINLLSESEEDVKNSIDFLTDFVVHNNFLGKSVSVGIPQSLIWTRVLSLPKLKGKELENAIKLEIEHDSPIPLDEARQTYQILPSGKEAEKIDVLVVIAPNSLTNKMLKVVKESGLRLESIEPNSLGTIRGIMDKDDENPTTLIVDIGFNNTDISIYSDYSLRFTRSISTGLDSIIRSVSQDLDLEVVQSREYVRTYGLASEKLGGKVKESISPIFSVILNEVKRSITFFETRESSNQVKRVVLCGGGSLIPGVVVHSANFLDTEVQISNPWNRIDNLGKFMERQEEIEDVAPLYTTAVGLALKDIN